MINWNKYPFARLIGPFALGVWFSLSFCAFRLSFPFLLTGMSVLLFFSVIASRRFKKYRQRCFFGMVLCCYLFFAGYALTEVRNHHIRKDHFCNESMPSGYYVARVFDYPVEREKTIRTVLELSYRFPDSLPSSVVSGRIMGYFQKTDSARSLRYGDMIAFPAPVAAVAGPANPGEFDYRAYLSRKGIDGQVYLRDGDWVSLSENRASPVYTFSYHFRDRLLQALQRCGIRDDEFGVAAAILLGYDENLPPQVRKNYVAAGAMHILCVSGMHVGIIYLIASFLLSFLRGKRWLVVLKFILLLALVWLYALIAGLSPSILRASLMISFVIIGEMIRRRGFVLNSIAASAFILLCANPNNLFEIGFLLSYMAVVGIVVLQKPIYRLVYVRNKMLDNVWQITSVALAAQLATFPVTVFYFHQFSTYFWLSNLLMTPISFAVILGGMILLSVSWIPYVNVVAGYVVWGTLYAMNTIVAWIESLPFSIIKGLYIDRLEYFLILFLLVLAALFVTLRRKRYLLEMLGVALVLMVSFTVRRYKNNRQVLLTVYSLRSHTAVDFIYRGKHVVMADSSLFDDKSVIDYSLNPNWLQKGLSLSPPMFTMEEDYRCGFLMKKENLISFGGKLFAVWEDGAHISDSLSFRIPVDYLFVTGYSKPDMKSVLNSYEVAFLLIDRSVPSYLAEKWEQEAVKYDVPTRKLHAGGLEISSFSPF